MTACCEKVIAWYHNWALEYGGERDGAALYCASCASRLVLHNGIWTKEKP